MSLLLIFNSSFMLLYYHCGCLETALFKILAFDFAFFFSPSGCYYRHVFQTSQWTNIINSMRSVRLKILLLLGYNKNV